MDAEGTVASGTEADTTAGDSMVSVTVSETYDLSTKVNKMGLVGIHTPTGSLVDKMWPGLVLQYKKFRFVKCDVTMACASMLPADPLQVGVEAGAIAPQDMFNPILYKAVSNDSMSNFLAYLQAQASDATGATVVDKGSVVDINDTDFKSGETSLDQFKLYYGLLADANGWKKAMPQAGLRMNGLYPLVYSVVSPYGQQRGNTSWGTVNDNPGGISNSASDWFDIVGLNGGTVQAPGPVVGKVQNIVPSGVLFRGPSMRMPAIDTTVFTTASGMTQNVVPGGNGSNVQSLVGHISPAYVGLIVLPPAKLNQLYYRLKVSWTIEFSGLRSMSHIGAWDTVEALGGLSYGTDYGTQSSSMSTLTDMVDASDGATVEKVMEGL